MQWCRASTQNAKKAETNKIILLILAIICSTTEVSCWWQVRQWKKNITEAVPLGKKSPVLLLLALAVSIIPHALILPFATNIMLLSAQDQTPGKPAELLVQEELHQTEPTAVKAGVQLLIQPVFCQPAATWGWAQWQPLGFLLLGQQETSLQGSQRSWQVTTTWTEKIGEGEWVGFYTQSCTWMQNKAVKKKNNTDKS